jgi:hypothetical protein
MAITTKSKETEMLENRLKRVEIYAKIEATRSEIQKRDLELKEKILQIDKMRKASQISELLDVARAWRFNSDAAIGTETKIESLWGENEMKEIKNKILEKFRRV